MRLIARRAFRLALLAATALLLTGCPGVSARVAVAPTLDGGGQVGFESTFSVGMGLPLDYSGRSHHFVQALGAAGGGLDGRSRKGMSVVGADVDYIYWVERRLDVRAGLQYEYRSVPGVPGGLSLHGFGGHLAILPVVKGDESSPIVAQFCLGPALRISGLWSAPPGAGRTLFALPLIAELNLLMAGD
jgi:hypothetical protein